MGKNFEGKKVEGVVNEDNEKFSKIFDSAPVLIALTSIDGNQFVEVNDFFLKTLGYKKEEVIGKSSKELDLFCDYKDRDKLIKVMQNEGPLSNIDVKVRAKNGRILDLSFSIDKFFSNGKEYLLTIAQDMTEEKKSEKKYQELFESLKECVAVYESRDNGKTFLIKDFNKSALKLENVKKQDIIGKDVRKVFPGVVEFGLYGVFEKVYKTGVPENLPIKLYRDDRISGWRENYVFRLDKGDVVSVYSDVTEKKNIEEEMKKSREMLQSIIDLLPVRIFWKDKDLNYSGCNMAFANDAGKKSPEELVGKDDFQMGWKDQAELYRTDDFKMIQSGEKKLNYEEPQTTPDGKKIWLLTNKIPLRDKNEKIIGVLGTYADITKKKKLK